MLGKSACVESVGRLVRVSSRALAGLPRGNVSVVG